MTHLATQLPAFARQFIVPCRGRLVFALAAAVLAQPVAAAQVCAAPWTDGAQVALEQKVSFLDKNYQALQAHIASSANAPPVPDHWSYLEDCTPDAAQPAAAAPEPRPAGTGVKPNPWTVRGKVAQYRCSI